MPNIFLCISTLLQFVIFNNCYSQWHIYNCFFFFEGEWKNVWSPDDLYFYFIYLKYETKSLVRGVETSSISLSNKYVNNKLLLILQLVISNAFFIFIDNSNRNYSYILTEVQCFLNFRPQISKTSYVTCTFNTDAIYLYVYYKILKKHM